MAEPIEYRILLNLQAALQGISRAGGYWFDVANEAVSIDEAQAIELVLGATLQSPYFVVFFSPSGRPVYLPAEQMLEPVPFAIIGAADARQLDLTSRAKTYQHLVADIEKAVTVDHQRGGLATDTRIVSKSPHVNPGTPRVEAVVQLEVRLYREYGAPNG